MLDPEALFSGESVGDAIEVLGLGTWLRGDSEMLCNDPGVKEKDTGIRSLAEAAFPAPFVSPVCARNPLCFCEMISSWSRCVLKGRPVPSLLRASDK